MTQVPLSAPIVSRKQAPGEYTPAADCIEQPLHWFHSVSYSHSSKPLANCQNCWKIIWTTEKKSEHKDKVTTFNHHMTTTTKTIKQDDEPKDQHVQNIKQQQQLQQQQQPH